MNCKMLSRSGDHLLHFGRKDKEAPNHLSFALLVAASAEVRDIMRAEMWLQRHDGFPTRFQFKHHNLVGATGANMGAFPKIVVPPNHPFK